MSRWWRSHSVRVRLTLWYAGAMIVVLGVYAAIVYTSVSRSLSDALNQRLRGDFQWAAAMIEPQPDGSFTWFDPIGLGGEESPWLQVWSQDGDLLYQSEEAQLRPVPESRDLALRAGDQRIVSIPTETGPLRILSRRGEIASSPSVVGTRRVAVPCQSRVLLRVGHDTCQPVVIQVGRWETSIREQLRDLALILVFGLPLGVAVAGLGGFALAERALAPVERMTERARTITAERLHDRLPVHNPDDEMGRLATVFNETLGRLEASFDQMRRFTADVSHELRTPLTAIRSVGEVGLREPRDEAAYEGIIGSMLEEVDRLSNLVDRLLTLSRAETGRAKLSIEAVDLRELAEDVVGYLGVLAEEKGQSLAIECTSTPRALADRLVLRQSLINLVDNAIKYTPVGGRIQIRVTDDLPGPSIEVIDTGPGIAPELRARIFDRYYRGAETVGGDTGGSGLGLAIAKWAVEAGGGHLSLERTSRAGSTFRIALPRAKAPLPAT